MNSSSPQIGFDRFIQLEWTLIALHIRAGKGTLDKLDEVLASSHAGPAAKKKTRTVLNRLWLEPRADLVDFADRGVEIFCDAPEITAPALTWGMALATYPFFGRVAEIVGRLTALQGDCTSAEVHRRMAEIYGEREGTRRMTNMVLQSQSDWGFVDRNRNTIRRTSQLETIGPLGAWLSEAAVRFVGVGIVVARIPAHPVLFPFAFSSSLALSISQSPGLHIDVTASNESRACLRE